MNTFPLCTCLLLPLLFIVLSSAKSSRATNLREPSRAQSLTTPEEGTAVDIVPWSYAYRAGAVGNPFETKWLEPTPDTLCGYLWEESRPVRRIEMEFPRGSRVIPNSKELTVGIFEGFVPTQHRAAGVLQAGEPLRTPSGGTLFVFDCPKDINGLNVLYSGARKIAVGHGSPIVRAFTDGVKWRKPLFVEIEWAFDGRNSKQWDGRVEAYNGWVGAVAPLTPECGIATTGEHRWKDGEGSSSRRGIRVQVHLVASPVTSRTVVTLWTRAGNFSFAPEDLDKGPILIPSVGIYVTLEGGPTAKQFQSHLAAKHLETVRAAAHRMPESSWESAMKLYRGNKVFEAFPEPEYETPMKIDVPEKELVHQWRLGYWHLKRWSLQMDDKTWCISIWPFKTTSSDRGTTGLGLETPVIIRALDLMGARELAQGGLNYWFFGDHAMPAGKFVDLGEEATTLSNAYNSPNHLDPGYDQHASGGHGRVLEAAGLHCLYVENNSWFQEVNTIIEKACNWIVLQRKAWNKDIAPKAWCYGLIPPTALGDGSDLRMYYGVSAWYYAGLKEAAKVLFQTKPAGKELLKEAERLRKSIRTAADRSMALSPVVQVKDGTYRRYVPFQPYMRGLGSEIPTGMYVGSGPHSAWFETVAGAMLLTRSGIYDAHESVVQEFLDVFEDLLVRNGENGQNGYNDGPDIHLLLDDVPMFLRGMYNAYAAEIMPGSGYIFRESEMANFNGGEPDKTFEEAAFLERVRMMLVFEEGRDLWLARATPRTWLEQGKQISVKAAPTQFGMVNYNIVSDVDNGRISAVVDLPSREAPQSVYVRFRHPKSARIKAATVNGKPWKDIDPIKEAVRLRGLKGKVTVEVMY